jgi:hypothetical protein
MSHSSHHADRSELMAPELLIWAAITVWPVLSIRSLAMAGREEPPSWAAPGDAILPFL